MDESFLFRCYHGPLLYEAKCVKIKLDDSSNYKYFVHYQGWNKNWDEWVNDTRILKVVAENLELKDKLLKDHTASVRDKKKASKTTGGGGPLGTPYPKDGGKKSSGGSANTSRASTPVRYVCKINEKIEYLHVHTYRRYVHDGSIDTYLYVLKYKILV